MYRDLNTPLVILITLLGRSIGWAGSKFLSSPVKDHSAEEYCFQGYTSQGAKNKLGGKNQPESSRDIESVSVTNKQSPNSNELTASLELIQNGSFDCQLIASQIIDYQKLVLEDPSKSAMQERRLRKLLRANPKLQFALLDPFASIDHAVKHDFYDQ